MSAAEIVIAIDGPAASGKSSVSRELARRTGFAHVNSGLMYRAAARAALDAGIDPADPRAVREFFDGIDVSCRFDPKGDLEVTIGGKVRRDLTADDVNASVSALSSVAEVRHKLVAIQRQVGGERPTVMEGRDIGSVVFPDTPFKYYIDASAEVRAARRAAQGVGDQIGDRDRVDSTRASSPLMVASDATVIDTSELSIREVVDRIIADLQGRGVIIREVN